MLARTGLTVPDHQRLTVERYDALLACDTAGIYVMPVLQGDYYPTPPDVTRALLAAWRPSSGVVWEPACGCGAMAREIEAAGLRVVASDVADRGYGEPGVDFLETGSPRSACVITNPPFDLAAPFIEHAFAIGVTEMALVLKSTYWHAASRHRIWLRHTPSLVMPLLWLPDFLGRGGPTMEICWTVWCGSRTGATEYRPLERPAKAPGKPAQGLLC